VRRLHDFVPQPRVFSPVCSLCSECYNNPLACFRSCNPEHFQDPADLRAELVPDEIDEEYLIYALFERDDRPDGAFLSKRWCSLEDILEHTPPGLMLTKIKEWNQGRAARESAAVGALFSHAEAELDGAGAEAMQENGEGSHRARTAMRCTAGRACYFDALCAGIVYSVCGTLEIILSLGGSGKSPGIGKITGGEGNHCATPGLDVKASSHRLRSAITMEGNSWDSLAKHVHANGRILCGISLDI
jgi:hypothetical protein